MAFTLSNLLQETYKRLGQWNESIVTGSSNSETVIEDSVLANEGADDDWKGGAIFLVYDSSGVGTQGEFSRITAYIDSSGKFTFDSFSTKAHPADRYGYVSEHCPNRGQPTPTSPLVARCRCHCHFHRYHHHHLSPMCNR